MQELFSSDFLFLQTVNLLLLARMTPGKENNYKAQQESPNAISPSFSSHA